MNQAHTTTPAAAAILAAAAANRNITAAGLLDELERGAIDGWMEIACRFHLTFGEWSRAMSDAAAELERRATVANEAGYDDGIDGEPCDCPHALNAALAAAWVAGWEQGAADRRDGERFGLI